MNWAIFKLYEYKNKFVFFFGCSDNCGCAKIHKIQKAIETDWEFHCNFQIFTHCVNVCIVIVLVCIILDQWQWFILSDGRNFCVFIACADLSFRSCDTIDVQNSKCERNYTIHIQFCNAILSLIFVLCFFASFTFATQTEPLLTRYSYDLRCGFLVILILVPVQLDYFKSKTDVDAMVLKYLCMHLGKQIAIE